MFSLSTVFSFILFETVFSIRNADLPIPANGTVLDIAFSLRLMDVSSIKMIDMDYRVDYFLTFEWKVHRNSCDTYISQLASNKIVGSQPKPGDEYLVRGFEKLSIWKPDIYIPEVKRHENPTTSGNQFLIMLLVESNDTCSLRYDSRAAAIVSCQMNFRAYPYDLQICPIRLRSHYYPIRLVKYRWSEYGMKASKQIRIGNYRYRFSVRAFNNDTFFDDEQFSWLEIDFFFERKISNFVVQVFGPSTLMLLMAYLNFWLNVNTGNSRFTITCGTFLSMVTQFIGVKSHIPRVSYICVIDIWMLTCMLFVWSTIAEVTVVNYLFKRRNDILSKRKLEFDKGKRYFEEGSEVAILQKGLLMAKEGHPKLLTSKFTIESEAIVDEMIQEPDLALLVDKIFRVLYPLAFLIFNAFFWILMLQRRLL